MNKPNRSQAVAASRATDTMDGADDFPTQPWAVRALCEMIRRPLDGVIWEPAAGRGHIVRTLREYTPTVFGSDAYQYSDRVYTPIYMMDFLDAGAWCPIGLGAPDWIITNPPFNKAEKFILNSIEMRPNEGVAFLVRTQLAESVGRYNNLFSKCPPSEILQFVERLSLVPGGLDRKANLPSSYCWMVWYSHDYSGQTNFRWIPPCRKSLERDEDYE